MGNHGSAELMRKFFETNFEGLKIAFKVGEQLDIKSAIRNFPRRLIEVAEAEGGTIKNCKQINFSILLKGIITRLTNYWHKFDTHKKTRDRKRKNKAELSELSLKPSLLILKAFCQLYTLKKFVSLYKLIYDCSHTEQIGAHYR